MGPYCAGRHPADRPRFRICLHVVRADHGAAVAAELARRLVTPPHRQGGQAQYARGTANVDDDWLAPLMDWANARLDAPLTIADLAVQAGVSIRTLERRFTRTLGKPPLHWLLLQRVRRAQQMLETTNTPVEAIATECGFGTATNMRAHFKKHAGVPPATYRRTFQPPRLRQAKS